MRERPNTVRAENGCVIINWKKEITEEERAWDTEYANEADRFAEIEAEKTGKKRWGRWYLYRNALVTRMCRPNEGRKGYTKGCIYDISLNRLSEDWVSHFRYTKNWVGSRGLLDLTTALVDLQPKVYSKVVQFGRAG